LRALAPIEHAVVPDDAHNPVAQLIGAGVHGRREPLSRAPISPRRQQYQLPLVVVDAGENVVVDQVRPITLKPQPVRQRSGCDAGVRLDLGQRREFGTAAGGAVSATISPTRRW
jgi:hypothetical protein